MDNNEIEHTLLENGIKPTAMRILVYRLLSQCRHSVSLKQMEERMVTADRSTIFRTLNLLVKHHLVHTIEDGSGSLKYELSANSSHNSQDEEHVHFHCEECQQTYCLHQVSIPQVCLPDDFEITSVNYIIKGICPKCRTKNQRRQFT